MVALIFLHGDIMKRIFKNKFIACIIAAAFALLAALFALPSFMISQKAYAYSTLPNDDHIIGNLYNSDKGKFDKRNLDLLAKKVGYTGIDDMVVNVSTEDTTAISGENIKTAADFGETIVNFGTYTFNGCL